MTREQFMRLYRRRLEQALIEDSAGEYRPEEPFTLADLGRASMVLSELASSYKDEIIAASEVKEIWR